MTTITATEPTVHTFTVEYLGEGNWEITAPNGVWTVTADRDLDGEPTDQPVAFHIEGPNHHHGEFWADTLEDVDQIVRTYGVDRRTAQA
jgi:hypothetical protein